MSLSSSNWGQQMFKIYFYHHSSMAIRPLSLLGLATVSLMNLLHSSASFITNHLFYLPWASLHCQQHLWVWSKPTEVTVEASRLCFTFSILPSPCWPKKPTRLYDGVEDFYWHRKNSSTGRGLAKSAQCHLLFDPSPISEAYSGDGPCQQLKDMEKNPSRQSECWDLCNQHKLE